MKADVENKQSIDIVEYKKSANENKHGQEDFQSFAAYFRKLRTLGLSVVLIAVVFYLIPVAVLTYLLIASQCQCPKTDCQIASTTMLATSPPTVSPPEEKSLQIVSRSDWKAEEPKRTLSNLQTPVSRVIVAHTAGDTCSTKDSCIDRVQVLQQNDTLRNNLSDITYNFLIGGDGNVYEGRGWTKQGELLRGENSISIAVAFIGDYTRMAPTELQLDSLKNLLKFGKERNFLSVKLFGEQQLKSTASPGQLLYEELKKFPDWSDDLN